MSQYKLNYFNVRGRGEVVRLVFHLAGIEFEDNRIEFQNWPQLKPLAPFNQLPYLEINDNNGTANLAQSISIGKTHIIIINNKKKKL